MNALDGAYSYKPCKIKDVGKEFLIMKINHYTVFILNKKNLKSMLIYYYYRILKITTMFSLYILIVF